MRAIDGGRERERGRGEAGRRERGGMTGRGGGGEGERGDRVKMEFTRGERNQDGKGRAEMGICIGRRDVGVIAIITLFAKRTYLHTSPFVMG